MNLPGLELPEFSEAGGISALRGIATKACDVLAAIKNESSDEVWDNAIRSNPSRTLISTPEETAFWKSFVNLHVAELEALEGLR